MEFDIDKMKDFVLFAKKEGVCSFEITDSGIKVSFDPRSFPAAQQFNNVEELKQSLAGILAEQDKARQEEENLLFASAL